MAFSLRWSRYALRLRYAPLRATRPPPFPNPICDRPSQPDKREAEDYVGADVQQSIDRLTIAQQIHRIVAKRGEGGEAAENAEENQRPRLRRERAARLGKLGEQTDHETTDQVDRQRAVGKINALAGGLRPRAEQIAGDRSQRAAEGNEGDVEE